MTTDLIHLDAEHLADQFRALGRTVTVSHSVNRNGGSSSYLSVSGISSRLRVSDHFSGTTDAWDVGTMSAAAIIEEASAATARAAARRAAELADRDQREAPFYQKWLTATEFRKAIVVECYPACWSNLAAQRAVLARWKARAAA